MKHLSGILPLLLLAFRLSSQNPGTAFVLTDTTALSALQTEVEKLYAKGKYPDAADLSLIGLQRVERTLGKEDPEYGNMLDLLGMSLHAAGKWYEARSYLEAGVEHGRIHLGENHADYLTRTSNLAMLYLDMSERSKAINMLELAVEKGETVIGESNPDYAVMVNNLGVAYDRSGYDEQALQYYQQAAVLTEKTLGKAHAKYALRLRNMARVQHRMGRDDLAFPLLQEALGIYERTVGKEHPNYLSGLFTLCNIYLDQKKFAEALAYTDTLVQLGEKVRGRLHPEFSKYLQLRAAILLSLHRNLEAKAACEEAEQINRQLYGEFDFTSAGMNLALTKICAYTGDLPGASRRLALAVQYLRLEIKLSFDAMSEADQENFLDERTILLTGMQGFALNHPEITSLPGNIYDMSLAVKSLTLGHHQQLLESLRQSNDTALVSAFYAWKAVGVALAKQYSLPESKRSADFADLQRRSEDLERQLAVRSAAFREARGQAGWRDVQQALHEGEVAIEFCHFKFSKGLAYGLGRDSTVYVALLLRKNDPQPQLVYLFEEKQLVNLKATRSLYAPPGQGKAGAPGLNQLVWQPLAPYLNGIRTIYYTPSGSLHRLNLGAIPIDDRETLSDHFQLFDLGSTRQIAQQEATNRYTNHDVLIFGGIDYSAGSADVSATAASRGEPAPFDETSLRGLDESFQAVHSGDWPYLPWTEKEAADIANLAEKAGASATVLKGREANEQRFKQIGRQQPSPRVLHLATHGYFFPDPDSAATSGFRASRQPLIRSGLILAGADAAWSGTVLPPGAEDGILTAYEIAQMDLSHTELVVLSACDTGLGDLKGNEGVFGLQRAFKMAGARYVIMSLWNVSDQHSYEFMAIFYREWLERGQDIPAAFQRAQNQMRKKFDRPFNPALWAGFVLIR